METRVPLTHPVTVNGQELDHLTLRRPKVRDMLTADKQKTSDAEKEIRLFANLCEVAPEAIENLDLGDYRKLQEAYQDFLS